MSKQQIAFLLQNVSLNLNYSIINNSVNFLFDQIGLLNEIPIIYQMYSALAIVCEISTIPDVFDKKPCKIGINVQSVMSHLNPQLNKEEYLNVIKRQLEKYPNAYNILTVVKKVEDVKYSYRFYQKYQQTFKKLYEHLQINLPKYYQQQYSAMFWMLYLYVKNSNINAENIGQAKTLLIILFRTIFQYYLSNLSNENIVSVMKESIGLIEQISEKKQKFYFNEFSKKLNFFYAQRYYDNQINFKKINENHYLERLVDDMSNSYEIEKFSLQYFNQIDQISYLGLKKDLTPMPFRRQVSMQKIQSINQRLSFDSDKDQDQHDDDDDDSDLGNSSKRLHTIIENQQSPTFKPIQNLQSISENSQNYFTNISLPDRLSSTPNIFPSFSKIPSTEQDEDNLLITPISNKIQNEKWAEKFLNSHSQKQRAIFTKFYEQNFKKSFEELEKSIKQKNLEFIKIFTPKCRNYSQTSETIFKFFIHILSEIYRKSENKIEWIQQNQIIEGFACLSSALFIYIKDSIKSEYKRFCDVYAVQIRCSFKPIQLFVAEFANKLPNDLSNFIKNIQKKLIVTQIWQNEQGFKILVEADGSSSSSQEFKLRQKMQHYSKLRIRQISKSASISENFNTKIMNILIYLFKQKPYIFRSSNLDQVLLCCTMSCLSINQKQQKPTLIKLFEQYNSRTELAYNNYQFSLKDKTGKDVDIVEFYNDYFLPQIQDMINSNNDEGLDKILMTPVRININKNEIKSRIGLDLNNIKETPQDKKRLIMQNLIKKQSIQEVENQDEEGRESPYFGSVPMKRNSYFSPL